MLGARTKQDTAHFIVIVVPGEIIVSIVCENVIQCRMRTRNTMLDNKHNKIYENDLWVQCKIR